MSAPERRRSARLHVFREEPAVVHSHGRELPVKIVDLSISGALLNILDMPALGSRDFADDERIELSMQKEGAVFQIMSRVVRTGPLFIAVEFIDEKTDVQKKLGEKLDALKTASSPQSCN